jgi:hypothetical protein
MSEEKRKLHVHEAMCAVRLELAAKGGITKDRDAPREIGGYKFRGIDDLDDVLCGLCAKYDLVIYPRVLSHESEVQQDGKGRLQRHVSLHLELLFVSARDGSSQPVSAYGEGIDTGDKGEGKAFSNARKIATFGALQIPTHGSNVEEYATQVAQAAPAPPQSEPKVTPQETPKAKAQRKQQTNTVATMVEGPSQAVFGPPPPNTMDAGTAVQRALEANTFGVLHAFASEMDGMQDPDARAAVFEAIISRAAELFAACQTAAEVKHGLVLFKALGAPQALAQAGNAAYTRTRQQPQPQT